MCGMHIDWKPFREPTFCFQYQVSLTALSEGTRAETGTVVTTTSINSFGGDNDEFNNSRERFND